MVDTVASHDAHSSHGPLLLASLPLSTGDISHVYTHTHYVLYCTGTALAWVGVVKSAKLLHGKAKCLAGRVRR